MAVLANQTAKAKSLIAKTPLRGMVKARSFWDDFRDFAFQGNLVDLAVGLVIGASFKDLTTSLVTNIIMPPIGLVLGNADFSQLYISLNGEQFESLAAATEAGAPVLMYGAFITQLIDFLLVALTLFVVLKFVLRHQVKK